MVDSDPKRLCNGNGQDMTLSSLKDYIVGHIALHHIKQEAEGELLDDPGHDIYHAQRVALWTLRLHPEGRTINSIAAALLHDIVNVPKNDPRRSKASELSAEKARKILSRFPETFSLDDIEEICLAIRDHSFSRGAIPVNDLGKALQDADRLEALGILGAFRNISCGVQMHASFFDPYDPWAVNRPLDDKKFSIDHYEIKLLKLVDKMNTIKGRQEGLKRTERLRRLLVELGDEIGVPYESHSST